MDLIAAIFAIPFAAFCVWLGVRVINRRERWAKWTAVAVLVLVVYPASLGPAAYLARATGKPDWLEGPLAFIYLPLQAVVECYPNPVGRAILAYAQKWDSRFTHTFF